METFTDANIAIDNQTEIPTGDVLRVLENSPEVAALTQWTNKVQGFGSRAGGLFERDRYVTPEKLVDQMKLAYHAAESDDVVSGVLETTEALAFSKMSFSCDDFQQEDIWNQIAADLDLDARLREIWREIFMVSQCFVALWWNTKEYKVRGKTPGGVKAKKTFRLRVPTSMSVLDPLKIIPVGTTLFGKEQLAWIADSSESASIARVLENQETDPDLVLKRMFIGKYKLTRRESQLLQEYGYEVGGKTLFLLDPNMVFRHTATRSSYQHFPTVRMASVFQLLDLKHQLRSMDRAHLLGSSNFLLVIKKGTDDRPATAKELTNLQSQVRVVARLPVLVSDHRLDVEIVTPKTDNTLKPERYNTLDSRISGRLLQVFVTGGYSLGTSSDKSTDLVKVIARGMESRRQMIKRTLEKKVFDPIFNANDSLTSEPTLRFHPKSIALDFDSSFASFLLELRHSNEISRETILSQFDLDQDDEAKFREREEEKYDEIFQTQVPFSTPNPKNEGRTGGRQGGADPGSGAGQPARNPRRKSDNDVQE